MVFSLFLKASKIFWSIIEIRGNRRVIRKSLMKNLESSGGLWLSQFVSSLTADHYFWCSGGVPCCFEGVPEYYGRFQGCSGVVPACSGLFRVVPGVFRGCSGDVQGCSGGFTDTPFCRGRLQRKISLSRPLFVITQHWLFAVLNECFFFRREWKD